jgi:hypothetical protein
MRAMAHANKHGIGVRRMISGPFRLERRASDEALSVVGNGAIDPQSWRFQLSQKLCADGLAVV